MDGKSFVEPSVDTLSRLVEDFEDLIKIITIAPELPGALRVIELCREKGSSFTWATAMRPLNRPRRANAPAPPHHPCVQRHARFPPRNGLVGFGLMDEDIHVEVIADMAHLHPQSLKMLLDMKSPDKIILISDSIKGPKWGSGPIRGAGGILMGTGIALADAVKNLITLGVPQERAIQFAADNPMKYLGIAFNMILNSPSKACTLNNISIFQ